MKVDYKDLGSTQNPVSNYCRQLIEQGIDPKTSLEAYKNGKLNMVVKEIGLAAQVYAKEGRFLKYRQKLPQPRTDV